MGKVRSKQFFARQQFNLRKQKEREEKEERQKQQEELKEAHDEVSRLEGEVHALQQLLVEVQDHNDALEQGNRENQKENTHLHEEIQRLQANAARRTTRQTRKKQ